jgi:leader peptidase (prepilin peptidase) / N-methyltransferase
MIHSSSGLPGAELVLLAMAFAWGAILGSFVNVVIHRVPRGESVVTHGSRCPACGAAIRPWDNVPILGWLLLRGRCRDCGTAISPGYPAVEAACGLIAMTIAAAELAGAGTPLLTAHRPGIDRLLAGDWRIALAWAIHTVIPVAMLAWNLTAWVAVGTAGDPERGLRAVTGRNGGLFVAAVIMIVTAVPAIGPPGLVRGGGPSGPLPGWSATLLSSCLGAVTGRLAGAITRFPGDPIGFAVFGAAAGWQAGVVVAIVTTAARRLVTATAVPVRQSQLVAAVVPAAMATLLLANWAAFTGAWDGFWRNLTAG